MIEFTAEQIRAFRFWEGGDASCIRFAYHLAVTPIPNSAESHVNP